MPSPTPPADGLEKQMAESHQLAPEPSRLPEHSRKEDFTGTLIVRSAFGGLLMGLANLVPGISGGTMLLASGIYPDFIASLAEVTRFRFRFRSLLVLGCVVLAAGMGILLLAGVLMELVVNYRWVMFSLFIGLTIGGVPIVWRLARPATPGLLISAVVSLVAMAGLAWLQSEGIVGTGGSNWLMLFFAGLVGASAMILPGLSGSYLLILMGQYLPILNSLHQFKDAILARELTNALTPAFTVLVPVGIGVVTGVIVVGNLLEWLMKRFQKQTLGVLIGLLLGSTFGLWPFRVGVPPEIGHVIKGQTVTAASLAGIDPIDWLTVPFSPSTAQVAGSLLLIVVGVGLTLGVAMIGVRKESE